ncbi:MAG: hypothetical protein OXH23_09010 [bacterium]|nr:hypothetical protein [bacterium]
MVARPREDQWSPAAWPVNFRWRLLATAVVLVVTVASIAALSRGGGDVAEVAVVAAAQRWPEGHPPGDYATISVPADLAALFVEPLELEGTVVSVDIPEGTLVSRRMLRSRQSGDDARTTSLMRFAVNADLWPDPGPVAGDRAVFSLSPGGCAVALVSLVAVSQEGAEALVTLEATPELASRLADAQWWIWESPPGGWPQCANGDTVAAPTSRAASGDER